MDADSVRVIARRMLTCANLMQDEAMLARAGMAKRPAIFLESIAAQLREDALKLLRGFPAAGGAPPSDPEDPTNPGSAPAGTA